MFLDSGIIAYPVDALVLVGVIFILYGVLISLMRIIKIEGRRCKNRFHEYENTKRIFIQKLIFGLDFFVAADLLRLAFVSGFNEIVEIALIVTIRTVLSWSLSKEVHLHEEKMK